MAGTVTTQATALTARISCHRPGLPSIAAKVYFYLLGLCTIEDEQRLSASCNSVSSLSLTVSRLCLSKCNIWSWQWEFGEEKVLGPRPRMMFGRWLQMSHDNSATGITSVFIPHQETGWNGFICGGFKHIGKATNFRWLPGRRDCKMQKKKLWWKKHGSSSQHMCTVRRSGKRALTGRKNNGAAGGIDQKKSGLNSESHILLIVRSSQNPREIVRCTESWVGGGLATSLNESKSERRSKRKLLAIWDVTQAGTGGESWPSNIWQHQWHWQNLGLVYTMLQ